MTKKWWNPQNFRISIFFHLWPISSTPDPLAMVLEAFEHHKSVNSMFKLLTAGCYAPVRARNRSERHKKRNFKISIFHHFPIFREWGAIGAWRGSGQGARVELCCFYLNCVVFTFRRLISRNIIRIDLPHVGVTSGEAWGRPWGPGRPPGPVFLMCCFFAGSYIF